MTEYLTEKNIKNLMKKLVEVVLPLHGGMKRKETTMVLAHGKE